MTDEQKLAKYLLFSRKNLVEACNEIGLAEIPEKLSVMQCVDCSIWVSYKENTDTCYLCEELDTEQFSMQKVSRKTTNQWLDYDD